MKRKPVHHRMNRLKTKEPDFADLIVRVRCGDELAESELKTLIYPGIKVLISRRLGKQDVDSETRSTFAGLVSRIQTGPSLTVRTLASAVFSSCEDGRYIRDNRQKLYSFTSVSQRHRLELHT